MYHRITTLPQTQLLKTTYIVYIIFKVSGIQTWCSLVLFKSDGQLGFYKRINQ